MRNLRDGCDDGLVFIVVADWFGSGGSTEHSLMLRAEEGKDSFGGLLVARRPRLVLVDMTIAYDMQGIRLNELISLAQIGHSVHFKS